ncbi:nucleotide exchange factor GrpE [Bacillus smithii]|nr:nucleotide exchange factor GrpE [Bacillus smithii]
MTEEKKQSMDETEQESKEKENEELQSETENKPELSEQVAESEEQSGESPENGENVQEENQTDIEKQNQKIKELETKLEEAENRYLRLLADFENYRRRVNIEKQASEKYRAQSLISDLLPVLDNFERALQVTVSDEQAKSLLQGMKMVYNGVLEALKKEGLEEIEAAGKEFDPNIHQAVMVANDETVGPNIVVEELQKGYKLKDRVIRPAMVKVNQ